jgi:hypothetical protein
LIFVPTELVTTLQESLVVVVNGKGPGMGVEVAFARLRCAELRVDILVIKGVSCSDVCFGFGD